MKEQTLYMKKKEQLYEGKAKKVFATEDPFRGIYFRRGNDCRKRRYQ